MNDAGRIKDSLTILSSKAPGKWATHGERIGNPIVQTVEETDSEPKELFAGIKSCPTCLKEGDGRHGDHGISVPAIIIKKKGGT